MFHVIEKPGHRVSEVQKFDIAVYDLLFKQSDGHGSRQGIFTVSQQFRKFGSAFDRKNTFCKSLGHSPIFIERPQR
jgi:hypothetical protein